MKVKGVNYFSPSHYFVPCGKCEECRQMLRSGWSFRLRAEVQQRCIHDGWHCGFATFTYNDEHLPHIPQDLFLDYDENCEIWEDDLNSVSAYGPYPAQIARVPNTDEVLKARSYEHTPCFRKDDVRRLIRGMRHYLTAAFGSSDFIYFIACEYGSNTQRPHLHGLFLWKQTIPDDVIYGLLRDYWCGESNVVSDDYQKRFKRPIDRPELGFICPRRIDGYAAAGENPFVVSDPLAAANYCSKYACKDLYFERSLKGLNIDPKDKRLRDFLCFHMQTKSLGVHVLSGLSDEQKLALYRDGFSFVGERQLSPIPIYLRNKLLFTPYYIVDESGRRLVRRKCTDFMRKHLDEIFEKKCAYYQRLFEHVQQESFFLRRFVPQGLSSRLASANRDLCAGISPRTLAEHYLTHYGLPYAKCYNAEPANLWAARFDEFGSTISPRAPLCNPFFVGALNDVVSSVLGSVSFCITTKYTAETELADKVKDFFTNINNIKDTICSDKFRSMFRPLSA